MGLFLSQKGIQVFGEVPEMPRADLAEEYLASPARVGHVFPAIDEFAPRVDAGPVRVAKNFRVTCRPIEHRRVFDQGATCGLGLLLRQVGISRGVHRLIFCEQFNKPVLSNSDVRLRDRSPACSFSSLSALAKPEGKDSRYRAGDDASYAQPKRQPVRNWKTEATSECAKLVRFHPDIISLSVLVV